MRFAPTYILWNVLISSRCGISNIPNLVDKEPFWKSLTMLIQSSAEACGFGTLPPPLSTLPTKNTNHLRQKNSKTVNKYIKRNCAHQYNSSSWFLLKQLYKKMIKNGKKKRCFLFSYVYITSVMYRKEIYREFLSPKLESN